MAERRFAALEKLIAALQAQVTALEQKCASCGGTAPAPPTPGGAPTPATPPAANGTDWQAAFQELNETVMSGKLRGPPGYCMTRPNVTRVYAPVTRFVYNRWIGNGNCVMGSALTNSPVTTASGINTNCRWDPNLYYVDAKNPYQPMVAYAGDYIAFRRTSKEYNVWLLKNKWAWENCDFNGAKLLAGVLDFDALEKLHGADAYFRYQLDAPGEYYFASDVQGKGEPARREWCWNSDTEGSKIGHPGKSWGRSVKFAVVAHAPDDNVMVECPLYDPSKYGVGGGGNAADSETVTRLKGAVAAVVRQLISNEMRMQQRVREEGQSGLTLVRAGQQGLDAYQTQSYASYGAANAHNHANIRQTVGLGEFQAVLNGVQFMTRHNDYSMVTPDATKTVQEYISKWPPPAMEIEQPPVPPEVLAKGSVDEQIKEMREYFKAWKQQDTSIRDYKPYFRPVLCYTEGAWTVKADQVAEPFASERHQIAADSWKEMYGRNQYMYNSGLKDPAENMPFLPTAILGQRVDDAGEDTFEPVEAQWFYRITCIPLKGDLPTSRLRVKNDLHVQLMFWKPMTREQLEDHGRALYELNPVLDKDWKPESVWPKGPSNWEYMDELMAQVPGLDGPQAQLRDQSFGPMCGEYLDSGKELNTAHYSRYFSLQSKDAMGRSTQRRAFNDLLFAARTTNKNIFEFKSCADVDLKATKDPNDEKRDKICTSFDNDDKGCRGQAQWDETQVGGDAVGAKCVWTGGSNAWGKCKYKKCWAQRWSYAIPLEIIYMTPLQNWNPFDLRHSDKSGTDCVAGGATGTKAKPFHCIDDKNYFKTPATMFQERQNVDPADTSGGITYVKDKNGVARPVRASGHWIHFPDMEGIGKIRQRYPLFPVHEHGNTIWKEVKALEELVVGAESREELRAIVLETRGFAYGTELLVLEGTGHEHHLTIPPAQTAELNAGTRTEFVGTSSLANGHTHQMKLTYDKATKVYSLVWCTMSPDWCPGSIKSGCGVADNGKGEQVSCCWGKCPDEHPGIRVIT
eukprot:TRINITY_DN9220_c0_g1_i1.p1 TRINITY_DN9220_c0_g1~~TRINITY_DN9220_c0_g1_i1.p1  ORF type:complete len:1154 (+),score=325.35 TRINITY_DN9220_c0_g1_i1:393-3464(+)